jgi:hypothetical protein
MKSKRAKKKIKTESAAHEKALGATTKVLLDRKLINLHRRAVEKERSERRGKILFRSTRGVSPSLKSSSSATKLFTK